MATAQDLIASGKRMPRTGYLAANRTLGRALTEIRAWPGRTCAWPLAGSAAAWQQLLAEASAASPAGLLRLG